MESGIIVQIVYDNLNVLYTILLDAYITIAIQNLCLLSLVREYVIMIVFDYF